jgi:hypothetical protein
MTLFDNDGRVNRGLAAWIGPILSMLPAAGGLVVIYVGLQSQNAVQDEQIRDLRARVAALSVDHDMLLRIDVRLANIEQALLDRMKSHGP